MPLMFIKFNRNETLNFDYLEVIKDLFDSIGEFKNYCEEFNSFKEFNIEKRIRNEREVLIRSLEGLDHENNIYDIFPDFIITDGIRVKICEDFTRILKRIR